MSQRSSSQWACNYKSTEVRWEMSRVKFYGGSWRFQPSTLLFHQFCKLSARTWQYFLKRLIPLTPQQLHKKKKFLQNTSYSLLDRFKFIPVITYTHYSSYKQPFPSLFFSFLKLTRQKSLARHCWETERWKTLYLLHKSYIYISLN